MYRSVEWEASCVVEGEMQTLRGLAPKAALRDHWPLSAWSLRGMPQALGPGLNS
jgi:hypothetical protein